MGAAPALLQGWRIACVMRAAISGEGTVVSSPSCSRASGAKSEGSPSLLCTSGVGSRAGRSGTRVAATTPTRSVFEFGIFAVLEVNEGIFDVDGFSE